MSVATATPPARTQFPRTRKPQVRTMRIERDPFNGGLVRITVDGAATLYQTGQIPLDPAFGVLGFTFRKLNPDLSPIGEVYHLTCSSTDPAEAVITCECLGNLRWKKCRHADALRTLLKLRKK